MVRALRPQALTPGSLAFAKSRLQRAKDRGWSGTIVADPRVAGRHYFRAERRIVENVAAELASCAHLDRGRAAWAKHDVESAIACFQAAVDVDPPATAPRMELAHALGKRGRFEESLRHYEEAHARAPSNFELTRRLVMAHHAVGHDATAVIEEMRVLWHATLESASRGPAAACVDVLGAGERLVCAYAPLTNPHEDIFFCVLHDGGLEGFVTRERDDVAAFGSPFSFYFGHVLMRAKLSVSPLPNTGSQYLALRQAVAQLLETPTSALAFMPRAPGTAPRWEPRDLALEGEGPRYRVVVARNAASPYASQRWDSLLPASDAAPVARPLVEAAGQPRPGTDSSPAEEWFEAQQVRLGEEVSWQGGALRLRFDYFNVSRPGLLERLLDGPVGLANLGVHLTTPAQGTLKTGCQTGTHRMFPCKFGPYGQQTSLRGPKRGVVFELSSLIDNRTALVRAGTEPLPSMLATHGSLESLDSEARSFIGDRLDREDMIGAEIPRPREPLEAIDGFSATLAPMSTGSLAVTFHRSAGRYFVCTFGGCVAPVETWRGPFVSSDHGWVPETRS